MPLICQPPCCQANSRQSSRRQLPLKTKVNISTRYLTLSALLLVLSGCGTVVAVADAVGTATVYAVKTTVNTLDAVTPDIVNDDDD